jgi:hypothetical protein
MYIEQCLLKKPVLRLRDGSAPPSAQDGDNTDSNTQHATQNTDPTLNQSSSLDKLFRAARIFFVLTTSAALGVYVYLGSLVRPIGDDYCISARLVGYNVIQAALYKYWYTSNRFSNEFVAAFSDMFGPRGVAVLAVGLLFLWLIGLLWLLYEAASLFRIRWNFWTGILLAELIVLVSYYSAANLFQSVLWRPGAMTYYLPMVAYAFIIAGLLRGTRVAADRPPESASGLRERSRILTAQSKGRASLWTITFLFFGAFFTGGLSETVGTLFISLLGLALVLNFIWNKGSTRRAALALITAVLAGALLALVGMFVTPANAIRLNGVEAPPISTVILRALSFALQFLAEAIRLLKQPGLFALGAGALLAYLSVKFGEVDSPSQRNLWLGLIVVPVLTYLLIVAAFAPSAYGQSYPLERVRFPAYILFTVALLLEGGLLGLLAAGWTRLPSWTTTLAVLALALAAVYPLWVTRNNLALVPEYKTRAIQWDQRDARIRELAAAGERDIVVWQLPGIANVKDLDTRASHWINYCAAIYYDVDKISAPQEKIPSP